MGRERKSKVVGTEENQDDLLNYETPKTTKGKDKIMQKLIKKFNALKIKFDHIEVFYNKFDDKSKIPLEDIEVRLPIFDSIKSQWDELTDELSQVQDDSYFEDFADECERFSIEWFALFAKFKRLSKQCPVKNENSFSPSLQSTPFHTKLPEPKIPIFDGTKTHWLEFKETFKTLIHENPNIPDIIKLTYLLDKLKGRAKDSVGFVAYNSAGYYKVWESLCNDYDDKRSIVDVHIKGLLELPRVSKDNYQELTDLINLVNSHVSSLAAIDYQVDKLSEMLLINIVLSKLNSNIRMDWEREIPCNSLPNWNEFIEFFKKQSRILQRATSEFKRPSLQQPFKNHKSVYHKPKPNINNPSSTTFLSNNSTNTKIKSGYVNEIQPFACPICIDLHHWLHMCPNFLKMDTHQRFEKSKEFNLCINCLKSKTHGSKTCPGRGCKICSNKHHTLLHHTDHKPSLKEDQNKTVSTSPIDNTIPTPSTSQNYHSKSKVVTKKIILATAIILVRTNNNKYIECRTLLDNASTSNYITDSFSNRLQLKRRQIVSSSVGLNNTKTDITEMLSAHIKSRTSSFEIDLDFLIVPTISESLPQSSFNISLWDIPRNINLADPNFNLSRPVDMLIGGETFFDLIQTGKIMLKENHPHLQQSVFGWVCVGALMEEHSVNFHISDKPQNDTTDDLNVSLKRFFDIDHIPDQKFLSSVEQYCESFFAQTTKRDNTGRYVVSLPLKENHAELGESKQQAMRRFLSLERKLYMNPIFKEEYSNVIDDYLKQGHMKPITDFEENSKLLSYYLPHHAVVKPSSSTTKVRVVFDASAKTSSNLSLNDVMFVGPTIQQSSFEILLRFRKHKFVFTSDINKMYRQVKIESTQTPLQRVLWRQNKDDPIKSFELTTVTFGTAAAPYLATRALKQLALDERHEFSTASHIVLKDFYVDDVLSGSDNLQDTVEMQQQLNTLLSHGGFKLHKWSANDERILENIPPEDREVLQQDESSSDECLKTLGLIWLPKMDVFKFRVPSIEIVNGVSKRIILSDIAKLYDPLGLLAPTIIISKMFVQSLWKCNLDWDDPIPADLSEQWNYFRSELIKIKDLKFGRRIIIDAPQIIQLHGFADASEKSYGACLYIRSFDKDQNVMVKLVCSKTRVAPIKIISLPRLELCAALLLSRLVKTILNSIDISFDHVYLWSDSTITLAWINTPPYKLKTFVANRVNEIQENTVNYIWNHVESEHNAADIITRGVMPSELFDLTTWWDGPTFLNSSIVNFKSRNREFSIDNTQDPIYEIKSEHVTLTTVVESSGDFNLVQRFSSYTRLLHVTAYCFRFIHNGLHRLRKTKRYTGNLYLSETNKALVTIVKLVQRKEFNKEIISLESKGHIPPKSSLLCLNPFIDDKGILRVGGRLSNSDFGFDAKHQILLPSNGHFTTIVAKYYHLKFMHAGPNLLVSLMRQRFWPISAKNLAKKTVRLCIPCTKVKPQIISQIMGDLPSQRITPSRPFHTTGVDLCGPFLIKNKKQRNSSTYKVYVAVFICFVTKGIHLEILSDLTTDCFIACMKRFIFRRGKPYSIWSDNATNFVGARNELIKWYQMFQDENQFKEINQFCRSEEIEWHFIPPRAPNFGGLWESAVKSLKFHLKRVASNVCLTYEELLTLVVQIEGILNSRPISSISTDPNDPSPLTPAHFLVGGPITAPPEPSLLELPENTLSRWQKVSQMTQHFWKRFSVEYLHGLQVREKWKSTKPDLKINDIVLVADEKLPSTQWMLGIVIELFEGKDKHSRVALIKTKAGNFKRSISKLSKLPIEQ